MKGSAAVATLLLVGITARAQTPEPPGLGLRIIVSPSGPAWVGQHVAVTVIARTPVRFAGPVVFPELATTGRSVVLPNGASTPGVERDGNRTFAVVQHRYDVFPLEAGPVVINPLALVVPVADEHGAVSPQTARTNVLPLSVRLPPNAGDLSRLVTSPHAQLSVTTDGDAANLQVGQALNRTVTISAQDSASMLLPPMPWTAPEGVRLYADPPELIDGTDRGVLAARRIDRAAFVPQTPGRYSIPGATMQWFNPATGATTTLIVPSLTVTAIPAHTAPPASWGADLAIAAAVLLIMCGGGWLIMRRSRRPASPELLSYRALCEACRAGDPTRAAQAFYRWTAMAGGRGTPRTAAGIAEASGTPSLATQAALLAEQRFGRGSVNPAWTGNGLRCAVRAARRGLHRRYRRGAPPPSDALPDLNPPGIQP
jgi:hypothetical protein